MMLYPFTRDLISKNALLNKKRMDKAVTITKACQQKAATATEQKPIKVTEALKGKQLK
jgi:hypothetical protein